MKTARLFYTLALAWTFSTSARDLFEVDANTLSGPPLAQPIHLSNNNLPDLVEDLIVGRQEFQALRNREFFAGLDYAGVEDALTFNVTNPTPNTWQARLHSRYSGLDRTFRGSSREDVENQIEDFLKQEGSDEWARFLKSMNDRSPVAATDGNPNSTTAFIATQTFELFSTTVDETREERADPKEIEGRAGFGFIADVGRFESQKFEGTTFSLPLFVPIKLTDRVGLVINLPLSYVEIEDAQIYNAGLGIGVPVKVVRSSEEQPFAWQLTPSAAAMVSGSEDLVAGGLLAQGALSSLLSYNFKHFTLSMGNQISFFDSVPLEVNEYRFDADISQQIAKNGLKISVPLGQRWVVSLYGMHSFFLSDAVYDDYYTVGGDIGYRFLGKPDSPKKKNIFVKLGAYADLADGYTAPHLQFGTGWKF